MKNPYHSLTHSSFSTQCSHKLKLAAQDLSGYVFQIMILQVQHLVILTACLWVANGRSRCQTAQECPSSCGQNNYCNDCGVCLPCDSLCYPLKGYKCDALCPEYSIHYMGASLVKAVDEIDAMIPMLPLDEKIGEMTTEAKQLPRLGTDGPIDLSVAVSEDREDMIHADVFTSWRLNALIITLLVVLILSVWTFLAIILCKRVTSKNSDQDRLTADDKEANSELTSCLSDKTSSSEIQSDISHTELSMHVSDSNIPDASNKLQIDDNCKEKAKAVNHLIAPLWKSSNEVELKFKPERSLNIVNGELNFQA
ncbi:hypothetical protein CAPTEDRAFT_190634 [Capitella teleta]|uniref:Uncharacterized protein n=1 Tax=Capitella teleta TaxID=283909 RepID=R7U4A2_CAPTE|nr:hypothetical protein CAPTEDRAFT_190634 [Capitella teleta]|eukprot:ELU00799.1 hypothetical protein CAPTEDRAFT_190634 [Capitella teleta]